MSFKGAIAEAESTSGRLAATVDALHWEESSQWQSMPWHEIARATWNSESGAFVITPVGSERREWTLTKAERLPETARERITATIVAQDLITVAGVGQVAVIFRHVGDEILAQTLPAVDPALVARQIAQVRGELGIG